MTCTLKHFYATLHVTLTHSHPDTTQGPNLLLRWRLTLTYIHTVAASIRSNSGLNISLKDTSTWRAKEAGNELPIFYSTA